MDAGKPQLVARSETYDVRLVRSAYLGVSLLAVAMAWPSLSGAFLSGDDIQLARDHVLVNHATLEHTLEMFRIVHRDLYQPVALLSYAGNVLLAGALGLPAEGNGFSVASLFHLTNILLHGLNAVLVMTLLRRYAGLAVAVSAAGIFAVHPLNVETVAWISGRMMLLSTLFLLASAILLEDWRRRGGWWRGAVMLLCVALCMMSKVRIALPVLLAAGPLLRWERPQRRWWMLWGIAAAITAVFVAINYQASSGMIERGGEALQGPRLVRTVLALGWYLQHTLIPTGLSPFHPTHEAVTWREPGLLGAAGVLLAGAVVVVWAARRSRTAPVAALWFLAALAVTLPILPSRNLAVAERYTYLPNIGLYWLIATGLVALVGKTRPRMPVAAIGVLAGVVAVVLLAASWRTCGDYRDDVHRAARIVAVYPDTPGLRARYASALLTADRFDEALAAAEADLDRHGEAVATEAWQTIGQVHLQRGDLDRARDACERAIAADPAAGRPYARLAQVHERAGEFAQAIEALEQCAQRTPNYNPALVKLAELYRAFRRDEDARRTYAQVLANNRHDLFAALGLAEMDIAAGRHAAALERLNALLAWMPENVPARINAGVCLAQLNQADAARDAYEQALAADATAGIAALNLAQLHIAAGSREAAHATLAAYLQHRPTDRDALDLACRNAIDASNDHTGNAGALAAGAKLLVQAIDATPTAADLHARYAWYSCLAGQWPVALASAETARRLDPADPWTRLARCTARLHAGDHESAIAEVNVLIEENQIADPATFDALAGALQAVAAARPDDPWPYYVLAAACLATDRSEAAGFAANEFRARTDEPSNEQRIQALWRGEE